MALVSGNGEITRETSKIVNMLCPGFVNIRNGFNFDLRCLATSSYADSVVSNTFSERRLGNVGAVVS
jgi:hypothetical protein